MALPRKLILDAAPLQEGSPISPSERLVYVVLASFASLHCGECFPSVATLCTHTALSRGTVKTALKTLEQHGIISVVRRNGGKHDNPNTYAITGSTISPVRGQPLTPTGSNNAPQRGQPLTPSSYINNKSSRAKLDFWGTEDGINHTPLPCPQCATPPTYAHGGLCADILAQRHTPPRLTLAR